MVEGQHVNDTVSWLFKKLKKEGVKRLGVERLHSELGYDNADSTHRFWKAVCLRAQRNGIELVSLHDNAERTLNRFFYLTYMAAAKATNRPSWKALRARLESDPGMPNTPASEKKALVEMAKAVENSPHRFGRGNLLNLAYAINLLISRRMHAVAEEKGLGHAVVGAFHAFDLHKEKDSLVLLDARLTKSYLRFLEGTYRKRIAGAEKYHSLLSELERIAEEPAEF